MTLEGKATLIGMVHSLSELGFESNIQVLKRRNSSVAIKATLCMDHYIASNEEAVGI